MSASRFPLLGPINLPLPIIAHASTITGLGLYLLFRDPSPVTPLKGKEESKAIQPNLNNPFATPPPPPGRGHEISSVFGLATVGLGLANFLNWYVEVERNQLLYASVPARLNLAGLATVLLLVRGRGMSVQGRRDLWGLVAYDMVSVLCLGWFPGEGGFLETAEVLLRYRACLDLIGEERAWWS